MTRRHIETNTDTKNVRKVHYIKCVGVCNFE